MTSLFNNLKILIDKYSIECSNQIHILIDGHENGLITDLTKEYSKRIHISSMISDFSEACIIILWFNGKKKYDHHILKLINEYIDKNKTFILIVPKDFDFDYIVKNTVGNAIDGISWLKEDNSLKDDQYLIVIKKY